jgi:hypothetical protein
MYTLSVFLIKRSIGLEALVHRRGIEPLFPP